MTWYEDSKDLWEIIDIIADDLIALPEWEEGDATWDTTTKTDENARRVVHHIADDVYLSLIMENGDQANMHSSTYYWWKGLIIIVSTAWDAVGHKPDGTKQYTFAGFECRGTSSSAKVDADLADFLIVHKLFTGADGFALVGIPPINATDTYQSNFIVVVERNTNKLYADGYSNFYVLVDGNYFRPYFNQYETLYALFDVKYKWWLYSHPFHLQSHRSTVSPYPPFAYEEAYNAFKSLADGKAYFMKPVLHNEETKTYPWLQPEFWIAIDSDKANLADDDEIAMPAPETKKYQVTLKQSPDSATYIWYAIIKAE